MADWLQFEKVSYDQRFGLGIEWTDVVHRCFELRDRGRTLGRKFELDVRCLPVADLFVFH